MSDPAEKIQRLADLAKAKKRVQMEARRKQFEAIKEADPYLAELMTELHKVFGKPARTMVEINGKVVVDTHESA